MYHHPTLPWTLITRTGLATCASSSLQSPRPVQEEGALGGRLDGPTATSAKESDIGRLHALYAYLDGEGKEDDRGGYQRMYIKDIIGSQRSYPILEVVCRDADDWSTRHSYLIGRPTSITRSPTRTGRAAKCYFAYDVENDRLVSLKEYWCGDADGVYPESDTYRELNAASVCQKYMSEAHLRKVSDGAIQEIPKARFLHRIVTDRIGRPLETYKDQEELITCLWNTFEAHRDAWENAGISHRDVSAKSIMIDMRTGECFLNDWDLSKHREELETGATQHERSETISAALLRFPFKLNQLPDDLESVLHVATIMGLRFHLHNMSLTINDETPIIDKQKMKADIRLVITYMKITYYHHVDRLDGKFRTGGKFKFLELLVGKPDVNFDRPEDPLPTFIASLYKLFGSRYQALDVAQYGKRYGFDSRSSRASKVGNEGTHKAISLFTTGFELELESSSRPTFPVAASPRQETHHLKDLTHADLNLVWSSLGEERTWPDASEKTVDQLEGFCSG
ncbi:hypothetical protein EVG20_g5782 [Dentipellis fragilis]|uniref:Fungal-type protein kinase domain-containing protein n=1 Tax=Dentipellis fragilis TaxID=205917 RepID=A0A4Y9YR97_9AGAM|nr:hypothetical protein EVG20_g5782 [Dentipellis fragilis]